MSDENKAFICGMLCLAGFGLIPVVCLSYLLTARSFTDGYSQGEQEGYKKGYVMSLVNQKKGAQHDFILVEQDNGEMVWMRYDEIETKKTRI